MPYKLLIISTFNIEAYFQISGEPRAVMERIIIYFCKRLRPVDISCQGAATIKCITLLSM